MNNLELSFFKYLFDNHTPISLVKSYDEKIVFNDWQAKDLFDRLAKLRDDDVVPDRKTLKTQWPTFTDYIDATSEVEIMAGDFQGYLFLLDEADKRRQREVLLQNMRRCLDINDVDGLLFNAEKLIDRSRTADGLAVRPCEFEDLLDVNRISAPEQMLSTGIPGLNQHLGGEPNGSDFEELGGLAFGEITIVAGYSNHGKTALVQTIWWNILNDSPQRPDHKSAFFSYEVRKDLFLKTLFAHTTGIFPTPENNNTVYYKNAEKEYLKFMEARRNSFLYYKENVPITVRALEYEIGKLAQQGYRFFVVDTINSVDNMDGADRRHTMEQAIIMLERVAGKHNISILITAQNKQALQFEDDKWPDLKWIGQSAYLQQKTGAGMGIYRADLYSDGTQPFTSIAMIKLRHRSPYPMEAVKVAFDKRRRLYVPYDDMSTAVHTSSPETKAKQVYYALQGKYAADFIEPPDSIF